MKAQIAVALLAFGGFGGADAGLLENAVRERGDGRLEFQFEARDGVCGDGHNLTIHRGSDGDAWECDGEIVYVRLMLDGGEVEDLDFRVGRKRRSGSDAQQLGSIDPIEAASYLLKLGSEGRARIADEAIGAAVLARDAVVWPQLLAIARDPQRPHEARSSALFWLGQEAGEKAAAGLSDFVERDEEDLELREHAIFALSQMDTEQSVPALMRIARTHESGRLRRSALFWLAQSEDERVIELFAEILEVD